MPTEIIPAILAKTLEDFQKDLRKITNSKNLANGWVHIDFMDNIFVPNQSLDPNLLSNMDFKDLKKEGHLMVKKPKEWIEKLLNLRFDRIIIHLEADGDIDQYIKMIKAVGVEVVVALNQETAWEKLAPFVQMIDRVLIMGVVPGFQGQSFIEAAIEKVRKIKSQNWPVKIEVDGAVKDWNAKQILGAGADCLVVGSYLVKGSPDENLEKLLGVINVPSF